MTLPPQCISAVFGSIVTSAFPSLIIPPPSSKDPYSVWSTWITQDNLPISRLILLIPPVESVSPGKVTWVSGSGVAMDGMCCSTCHRHICNPWQQHSPSALWRLVLTLNTRFFTCLLSLSLKKFMFSWLTPSLLPKEKRYDPFCCLLLYEGLHWWLRWYRICLQCRRPRFNPWVGKIPWRRAWHLTPVFLPGESP